MGFSNTWGFDIFFMKKNVYNEKDFLKKINKYKYSSFPFVSHVKELHDKPEINPHWSLVFTFSINP